MSEPKKSYYAIIPANVRYDEKLTPNSKLLYGEITALCNEKGYCWAGNQYFADLYGVSKRSITNWIKSLIDGGYISTQVEYKEGSKEIKNRYIRLGGIEENFTTYGKKLPDPIEEKFHRGIEEKFRDNNTSFNTTSNTTFNNNTANLDSLESRFDEIWKLYPNKKGKAAALKAYKRSVNKGVTDQDIKKGIERYVAEVKHKRTAPEYIKHGSTWFNQESWMDDYETTNETGKVGAGYAERLGF